MCVWGCNEVRVMQWCFGAGRVPSSSENSGGNMENGGGNSCTAHRRKKKEKKNYTHTQKNRAAQRHTHTFPPLSPYLSHFNIFLSTPLKKTTALYHSCWNLFVHYVANLCISHTTKKPNESTKAGLLRALEIVKSSKRAIREWFFHFSGIQSPTLD